MKKIYYIIFSFVFIIFVVWIANILPQFISKVFIVTSDIAASNSTSQTGSFGYKSASEQEDLLIATLKLNTEFIQTSSPTASSVAFPMKNFYKLEKFFPDFKSYYSAKLKLRNVLQDDLVKLYNDTCSKDSNELQQYFTENAFILSQKFGITEFNDFENMITNLKQTNGQNILSCELENSYFYLDNLDILNFRIILTLEDNSIFYLFVQTYMYENTDYQSAPIIKFYGISGGTEYV